MNYDKKKYKVWDWKSPMILHWILNPGLAFNELALGQTIPKVMLIDRESEKSMIENQLVPCPHCGTQHNGLKWSSQNNLAFKNWFGYYCDNCKGIIPVHRNLTSLIILTLTFPIWGWFRKSLKQNWLDKQPERYKNLTYNPPEQKIKTKNWLKEGLSWGLFMFVFMQIGIPWIMDEEITTEKLILGLPIWLVLGIGVEYIEKLIRNRIGKGKANKANNEE